MRYNLFLFTKFHSFFLCKLIKISINSLCVLIEMNLFLFEWLCPIPNAEFAGYSEKKKLLNFELSSLGRFQFNFVARFFFAPVAARQIRENGLTVCANVCCSNEMSQIIIKRYDIIEINLIHIIIKEEN